MDPLTRLVAIEEIKQLKARYFRLMDTREWEELGQVFTEDGVFDCTDTFRFTPLGGEPVGAEGPVHKGRAALVAMFREGLANQTTVHHGHCHEVTIDSETEAHGVIAMQDFIRRGDRTTQLLAAAGHYWETYRYEDGAWRIAHSRLTRLFSDIDTAAFYAPGLEDRPEDDAAENEGSN